MSVIGWKLNKSFYKIQWGCMSVMLPPTGKRKLTYMFTYNLVEWKNFKPALLTVWKLCPVPNTDIAKKKKIAVPDTCQELLLMMQLPLSPEFDGDLLRNI